MAEPHFASRILESRERRPRHGSVRSRVLLLAATLALLAAGGCGGVDLAEFEAAREEVAELRTQILEAESDAELQVDELQEVHEEELAALKEERDELVDELSRLPDAGDLERQISDLEDELRDAEDRALTRSELEEREADLEERKADLDGREEDLDRRASTPDPDPAQQEPETTPAPPVETGCASGQIDINSASPSELERLHQVGPDRSRQIVALRPFSSVDDLTRVSGIGAAHLSAIRGQGLACVK
jgi:DNA uptake protein ComE-like DNA-binding protein